MRSRAEDQIAEWGTCSTWQRWAYQALQDMGFSAGGVGPDNAVLYGKRTRCWGFLLWPGKVTEEIWVTFSEHLHHDGSRTQDGKDEIQTWPYVMMEVVIASRGWGWKQVFHKTAKEVAQEFRYHIDRIDIRKSYSRPWLGGPRIT